MRRDIAARTGVPRAGRVVGDPVLRRAGQRHQRNGFRTRKEAGAALDEALRRVRLGPLFKPRMTLRELDAAYLEQYDAAESSVKWLRYNLGTPRSSSATCGSRS